MQVGALALEWRGDRVEISRDGRVIATARWWRGALSERSGALAQPDREEAIWQAIAAALQEEEDAIVASSTADAYDSRGVDLGQIDWMLSLSPRERLAALEAHVRSMVPLMGDAPRD